MNLYSCAVLTSLTIIGCVAEKLNGGALVVPLTYKSYIEVDQWTVYIPVDRDALTQISQIDASIISRVMLGNSQRMYINIIQLRACIEGLRGHRSYMKRSISSNKLVEMLMSNTNESSTLVDNNGNYHDIEGKKSILVYGISEIDKMLTNIKQWLKMASAEIVENQLLLEKEIHRHVTFCQSIEISRMFATKKLYKSQSGKDGIVTEYRLLAAADSISKVSHYHIISDDPDLLFTNSKLSFYQDYRMAYFKAKISVYSKKTYSIYRIVPLIQRFDDDNHCIYMPITTKYYANDEDDKPARALSDCISNNNNDHWCQLDEDGEISECLRKSIVQKVTNCNTYLINCPSTYNEPIDDKLTYRYVNSNGSFMVSSENSAVNHHYFLWKALNVTINRKAMDFSTNPIRYQEYVMRDDRPIIEFKPVDNTNQKILVVCVVIAFILLYIIIKMRREIFSKCVK